MERLTWCCFWLDVSMVSVFPQQSRRMTQSSPEQGFGFGFRSQFRFYTWISPNTPRRLSGTGLGTLFCWNLCCEWELKALYEFLSCVSIALQCCCLWFGRFTLTSVFNLNSLKIQWSPKVGEHPGNPGGFFCVSCLICVSRSGFCIASLFKCKQLCNVDDVYYFVQMIRFSSCLIFAFDQTRVTRRHADGFDLKWSRSFGTNWRLCKLVKAKNNKTKQESLKFMFINLLKILLFWY